MPAGGLCRMAALRSMPQQEKEQGFARRRRRLPSLPDAAAPADAAAGAAAAAAGNAAAATATGPAATGIGV
eukprot:366544-Chlamydomonas_euryale.AAC.3